MDYKEFLEPFQFEMDKQLKANQRKGDRAGWLSVDPMQLVLEVYYHNGKLQEAVKNNNLELIKEYSADVANLAMMVLDSCGGLISLPKEEQKIEVPNVEWTNNIVNK